METTNLEVDAGELMERIRRGATNEEQRLRTVLPLVEPADSPTVIAAAPPAGHLQPKRLRSDKLAAVLQRASEKTKVDSRIPKFLRWLFRKQGGYNELILEAIAVLARMIESLHAQSCAMAAHLEAQAAWLETFIRSPQSRGRAGAVDRTTLSEIGDLRNRLVRLEANTAHDTQMLERQLERSAAEIEDLRSRLAQITDKTPGPSRPLEQRAR